MRSAANEPIFAEVGAFWTSSGFGCNSYRSKKGDSSDAHERIESDPIVVAAQLRSALG